jgi:hypothetical protein
MAEYLIRKRVTAKSRAHVWLGTDTLCRMAGTNGLNPRRYRLHQSHKGLSICGICQRVADKNGIMSGAHEHEDS